MEKFRNASSNARKGKTKAVVMTVLEFLMKKISRATIVSTKFIFWRKHFHPRTFRNLVEKFFAVKKLLLLFINTKGDER